MKTKTNILNSIFAILIFAFYSNCQASQVTDSIKLLLQESKYEQVIQIVNRLKQNNLTTSFIYYCEGISYKNLYKVNEAIGSFQKAYKTDTLNYNNLIEIANCYKLIGAYKNAVIFYEKSSVKFPENKTIQIEIANMYFALENYNKAYNLFQRIYSTDTSNLYIIINIAKCYDNLDKDDSAIFYYRKYLKNDSTNNQAI